MRLQQYLNEKTFYIDDIDEILSILKKDCKQYISDAFNYYDTNFLYSGRHDQTFFAKKRVRKNRNPKDTPVEIHNVIDDWFKEKFGIRFRSNSIFTSFSINIAGQYGSPFMIFPIGKYMAVSSPRVQDMFEEIGELLNVKTRGRIADLNDWYGYIDDINEDEIFYEIEQFLDKKCGFKDIRKGYKRKSEVMLHCKEYYILSCEVIQMEIGENKFIERLIND